MNQTNPKDPEQIISALLSNPDFLHLRKEVIVLPGRADPFVKSRKILILETCGLTETKRGRIDREIKTNPITLEFIDPKEPFGAARLYQDLAGVSFGDVPSLLEFLAMLHEDQRVWLDACIALNPESFDWMVEAANTVAKEDLEGLKSLFGLTDGEIDSTMQQAGQGKKKPKPKKSRKRIK